jgi:hypothetical protein
MNKSAAYISNSATEVATLVESKTRRFLFRLCYQVADRFGVL